jgi:hypothetical protein
MVTSFAPNQAPVGLGPDHHLGRGAGVGGQQLLQRRQPGQPLGHPASTNHPAALGHDDHIMVLLSPIQPDKQHPVLPLDRHPGRA